MSKFFKGIAKGVGNIARQTKEAIKDAAELSILDNLVDSLNRSFDVELMKIAKTFEKSGIGPDEAGAIEADLKMKYFQKYDTRAQKDIGRKLDTLAIEWASGNDILEVRKRILERSLDKKFGFIYSTVEAWRSGKVAMHAAALSDARIKLILFQDTKRKEFPMDAKQLETSIDEYRDHILITAGQIFPPGIDELRCFCYEISDANPNEVTWHSFVTNEVPPALFALMEENYAAIADAKAQYFQMSLLRLQETLCEQVRAAVDAHLATITEESIGETNPYISANDRLLLIHSIIKQAKDYEGIIKAVSPFDGSGANGVEST